MQKQISLLEQIQRIDLEMQEIEIKSRKCPVEIEKHKEEVDNERENIKQIEEYVRELVKKRMALEGELDLYKEKIKGWQRQLNQATNEKEYRAFLKEINGIKKENEKREEEILEIMEKIEEGKEDITGKEKVLQESFLKFEDVKKEIEENKKALDKELAEKKRIRLRLAKEIKPDYLRRYKSIREGSQGIAVVPASEGICLGCYMSLPPQTFIHIQKRDRLVVCPYCHRILYWKVDKEPT